MNSNVNNRQILNVGYYNNMQNRKTLDNDKKIDNIICDSSSSEEDITPEYIIKYKPKTKIVREFFRSNLNSICDEDEINFINK
jgi:hypothetical protein